VLRVSGRNAGENEGIIDTADKDAIEEVELAYNDVKVIDYLDITEQGNNNWESAKKR
jgi:dynein heavy chain 1